MAKLARSVHVTDPKTGRRRVLNAGEEPAPHLAALVRMASAWEGGTLPPEADADDAGADPDDAPGDAPAGNADDGTVPSADSATTKPAARKTAAKKPARGRTAAAEGTGGR
ncbi:hypothetical protein [Streptomyces sp. NRRL F-5135]|uniref:hypothetical protein n=1 Tax=Streptomyces sp. NRRL F-5135 TaxID=1463858 RepID=UPI0004C82E23|nr:hypothetical protein [Streptomyces sp. NRRL F-5135]